MRLSHEVELGTMHIYGALRAEFEHEVNEPAFRSPKALCRRTKENTNAQRFISC